jgi:hypothetical protein
MARVEELLELLNTLILSSVDNKITIDKENLQSVVTYLHVMQTKEGLLQTQTHLLHDALVRQNLRQHFEHVLVQNPLFKDEEDDEVDSDQQSTQGPHNEPTPDSSTYQLPLSNRISIPWEEIIHNKHRTNIGYEKDVIFHNLDYTKPIKFQSVGLLQDSSHSLSPVQDKILICQHCQRVGHIEIYFSIFILARILENKTILQKHVSNAIQLQE